MYKVWVCKSCGTTVESSFPPNGWLRGLRGPNKTDWFCESCQQCLPVSELPEEPNAQGECHFSRGLTENEILVRTKVTVEPVKEDYVRVVSFEDDSIWVGR